MGLAVSASAEVVKAKPVEDVEPDEVEADVEGDEVEL
jgi:hypothetical protein